MSQRYSASNGDGVWLTVLLVERPPVVHTVYENPVPSMMKQSAMYAVRRSWEGTQALVRVVNSEVSCGSVICGPGCFLLVIYILAKYKNPS